MKTIGLIGGISWESSAVYYNLINQRTKSLLGGFHSCKCILLSVDFAEVEKLQMADDWPALDALMIDAGQRLEKAGADLILICANTMHLCAPAMQEQVSIPIVHIAEVTADAILEQGLSRVGLLGTRFTMEKDFFRHILEAKGIEVLIPDTTDRREVHRIIYEELVQGKILDGSRQVYQDVIAKLAEGGAEGVILGCTEIPLLISDHDVEISTFNTTQLHAERAVEFAVQEHSPAVVSQG